MNAWVNKGTNWIDDGLWDVKPISEQIFIYCQVDLQKLFLIVFVFLILKVSFKKILLK